MLSILEAASSAESLSEQAPRRRDVHRAAAERATGLRPGEITLTDIRRGGRSVIGDRPGEITLTDIRRRGAGRATGDRPGEITLTGHIAGEAPQTREDIANELRRTENIIREIEQRGNTTREPISAVDTASEARRAVEITGTASNDAIVSAALDAVRDARRIGGVATEARRVSLLSLEDRMRRISRLTQTTGAVTLTPRTLSSITTPASISFQVHILFV